MHKKFFVYKDYLPEFSQFDVEYFEVRFWFNDIQAIISPLICDQLAEKLRVLWFSSNAIYQIDDGVFDDFPLTDLFLDTCLMYPGMVHTGLVLLFNTKLLGHSEIIGTWEK
jgi:hypothetical protein